jgi:hypothetical protein
METHLLKTSLSSCSDTNWPRLATNRVEQGALFNPTPGCDEDEPTGEASAGDGKKCGRDAWIDVRAAVGCGMDSGGCR